MPGIHTENYTYFDQLFILFSCIAVIHSTEPKDNIVLGSFYIMRFVCKIQSEFDYLRNLFSHLKLYISLSNRKCHILLSPSESLI